MDEDVRAADIDKDAIGMTVLGKDPVPLPEPKRIVERMAPGRWLKVNLFNTPFNSVLTVIVGLIAAFLTWQAIVWLISIDFTIIRDTLRIFMIGQFPDDELWRLWVSAFIVMAAIGLAAGSIARNSYELAELQGIEAVHSSSLELARRFWAIIGILIFFSAFAQTWPPRIGVVAAIATVFVVRELAWRAPKALRTRAIYVTALLVIASMLVIAGTSTLGGACVGLVVFIWVLSELGRRDVATTTASKLLTWLVSLAVAAVVAFVIRAIGFDGFGWADWGGLQINLFTAVVGVTLGMPFGILLALGRRSQLPVIKTASVLYIEFIRGVPLISLLLFSSLLLPFFLPIDFERPADLTLAIVVIMGFSAAYIAEIVRGGLQAVPNGQTEAAQALGLAPGAQQRFIVLPQALRAVIPAMVGQFIALFKDTSLLAVVGILEFLSAAAIANNQPQFLGKGLAPVTYLFVALGFWAFSYTMSKESRRLEARLGIGQR
ncbi:amino acid ABC transporter permease [Ilumatobacter sp.]|uniref:amino acid ABC transporter permease n=1 Tax=Ilumatobacter sp. TaxID=1967498 RepID=UPI003AF63449